MKLNEIIERLITTPNKSFLLDNKILFLLLINK